MQTNLSLQAPTYNSIPHHTVTLWVGVSCPTGEYPAFQSNITACSSWLTPTHQAIQWPHPDHNMSLHCYENLKTPCFRDKHTFASHIPHCQRLVTCPPCRWNTKGGREGDPSWILLVMPRPNHILWQLRQEFLHWCPSTAANNHKL
jgi:hypothetical protein